MSANANNIIQALAAMKSDDECPGGMSGDDAVEALDGLIREARTIVASTVVAQKQPTDQPNFKVTYMTKGALQAVSFVHAGSPLRCAQSDRGSSGLRSDRCMRSLRAIYRHAARSQAPGDGGRCLQSVV
jgi:hypothetical protein